MVYITRGTVKEIVVDGTSIGSQTAVYLPVNRAIAIHFTGELEWVWPGNVKMQQCSVHPDRKYEARRRRIIPFFVPGQLP